MPIISSLNSQLADYGRLMRIDKPIGTYLLLWPTLWALWIAAEGFPDQHLLLIFVLGTFLMRSAGCVINDLTDKRFDAHVERTRDRPIATGRVSKLEAVALFLVLVSIAFYLVLLTNTLTISFAAIALAIAALYPFMKRLTYMPQAVLGVAFSMGIPMAFAAQTNTVPSVAWLLFSANVLWTVMYDTFYAMVDRDDDLKLGIKSSAILFGDMDKLMTGLLQLLVLLSLAAVGYQLNLDHWYFAALGFAAVFFAYQQYLVKDRFRILCFNAFVNNHWVGLVIFIGILLSYGYR